MPTINYQKLYGSHYTHRKLDTPPNWELMVQQKKALQLNLQHKDVTPEDVIDDILSQSYLCNNHDFLSERIVGLHVAREQNTDIWRRAIAIALMAQGRHDEVENLKDGLSETEKCLVAARFEWPYPSAFPKTTSQQIKRKMIFGAAAAHNLKLVQSLHVEGVDLNNVTESLTLATFAAVSDNLPLIQYLYDEGVNILKAPFEYLETPLYKAAESGSAKVAHFIINHGGQPQDDVSDFISDSPFNIALCMGKLNILKICIKHTPDLVCAKTAAGELVMGSLFDGYGISTRIKTIKYLIKKAHLDVNAADKLGHTLAHLTAMEGDLELMKLLSDLGAKLTVEDSSGQTPQELAGNAGHEELVTWLMVAPKRDLVLKIISSQRDNIIQDLVSGGWQPLRDEKINLVKKQWFAEHMDDKLAPAWINAFSKTTLQQWNDKVLGHKDLKLRIRAGQRAMVKAREEIIRQFILKIEAVKA